MLPIRASELRNARHLVLGLLAALVLVAPCTAHAWAWGDTLTTIWRPLPNLPALARPGDVVRVWANAPGSATGWSAILKYGSYTATMLPAGGGYIAANGRWELGFTVPAGTPEDVFDLVLLSSATAPDTSRHAVKVLPLYRTSYYFAQISDTHLPEHTFSVNNTITASDTSGFPDFNAVVEDLNVIHPEFILHTGDLVNEGELEDFLGMFEMSRAKDALSRLRDPVFVVTGNHDIGGWQSTAPPDGTSRFNWWKLLGWPFLKNPPAGDPGHSQDYSFDYGLLHCIGLEAYINNGSYDHYLTNLYGAQSFSPEQMSWLAGNIAAVPAGHTKLLFYHYDFGGTLGNGLPGTQYTQISPAALGIDGAIWGHFHTVGEDVLTARSARPFNLGIQSVIDGHRTFRIFRVTNGVMTPGPMHYSGGTPSAPTDSLQISWNAANNGSASNLTATAVNRFGEAWEHARLLFRMAEAQTYAATGGTIAQVFRHDGLADVDVDCVVPASGTIVVNLQGTGSAGVGPAATRVLLANPVPNPFLPAAGALEVTFALSAAGTVDLAVYDLLGRRVASLMHELAPAGQRSLRWDGHDALGRASPAGIYLLRLEAAGASRTVRFVIAR